MRAAVTTLFFRCLALLPLRVVHGLGALLGVMFWRFPTRLRATTTINIQRCFPELNDAQKSALVRANLKETGKTLLEVGPVWFWGQDRLLGLIHEISGEAAVHAARAAQRSVIFCGPHLGSWELVGVHLAVHYHVTMMYRPPRLRGLDPLIVASRERFGAHLVQTNAAGVRELYQVLNKGGCIGILPDQDPGDGSGTFAPFFGIPAYTMTLVSRLARKSNAVVFFVYAERHAHGDGYHLHFVPAHPDIAHTDANIAAQHLNTGVEQCVRALRDQYQWSYKRFKTRPEGEGRFY